MMDVLQDKMQSEQDIEENIENQAKLPVVPLRGMVIFPNTEMHLDLGRKFSIQNKAYLVLRICMRLV